MEAHRADYELIFTGIKQSGEQGLQRLRAALVGELQYSVEEARRILGGIPFTLKRGESADLSYTQEVLERAGACLSLVKVEEVKKQNAEDLANTQASLPQYQDESVADLSLGPAFSEAVAPAQIEFAAAIDAPTRRQEALDPLEQITDLFRDLEEACVIGQGEEVLREISKSVVKKTNQNAELSNVVQAPAQAPRFTHPMLQKRFWVRVVTWPEMLFGVGFSLLLALFSVIFGGR